jgi:branched-chain amino acid transport system permease protein
VDREIAYFIQLVIEGLSTGSIYAALALAIVLVNRATGIINFAQGSMAVLSTFAAYALVQAGVPLPVAALIAIAIGFVLGATVERVIVRPFEGGDPDTTVVVTIGLFVTFTGVAAIFFGYEPRQFPSFVGSTTFNLGGVFVDARAILNIVVLVLVMVVLQFVFRATKLGLAMRAVADNPQSAALSGLPVSRLLMIGWGLAAALGAVAGILVAPQLFVSPVMLDFVLVYALAAAILGGLDSPLGAVVAAWIIGVVENLAAAYIDIIGNDLKIAVPLILMIVILIVRPQGLFGRKVVVRV